MKYLIKKLLLIKQSQRGDTIVEVLISVTILALVLATAYISSSHSLKVGTEAGNRSQALSYAQKQVELIKDAYSAVDQSRYCSYTTNSTDCLGAAPPTWFCIKDDGSRVGATVNIDPNDPNSPKVCRTSDLNQGIGGQYQVGDFYNVGPNQFTIKSSWPGSASNSQQQLSLYYRPSLPRPKVSVSLTATSQVPVGSPTTLSWNVANATTCTVSNDAGDVVWTGSLSTAEITNGFHIKPSGPLNTVSPVGTHYTFNIKCANADSGASDQADVIVTPPPAPVVTVCVNNTANCNDNAYWGRSYRNRTAAVTWSATASPGFTITSCAASNDSDGFTDWSGAGGYPFGQLITGGSHTFTYDSIPNLGTHHYHLSCTDSYGGTGFGDATYRVDPEPLVPHLQLWDTPKNNMPQCSSGVPGFGWAWACSTSGGNVWQIDGPAAPPPNGDGLQGDGGWRAHAGSGSNIQFFDCTKAHIWKGVWNYNDYVNNYFTLSDTDITHRFRTCGGYWYANSGSAGLPDVSCTMYSNNISLGAGSTWTGGLPILGDGNAFFFPGVGWLKNRAPAQMVGGYNNLQLHCSDNGGTRNAPYACEPASCAIPALNELDCHIGSPSGPDTASFVVEGTSIDITVYATNGNGNYVWNTDSHNSTSWESSSHTFTYGRPTGNGATHQIYLESGDLTHAYNGQGNPANGDDPSCTVTLAPI